MKSNEIPEQLALKPNLSDALRKHDNNISIESVAFLTKMYDSYKIYLKSTQEHSLRAKIVHRLFVACQRLKLSYIKCEH